MIRLLLELVIRRNSWVCSFLKASNIEWWPWNAFECLGLRLSKLKDVKSGCKGKDLGTLWRTGFWVVSTTWRVVVSGTTEGTTGGTTGGAAGAAGGAGAAGAPAWHFLMGLEVGWGLSRALSCTFSMTVLSQMMSDKVLSSMASINVLR